MPKSQNVLLKYLVQKGFLSESQLKEAELKSKETGESTEQTLIDNNLIREEQLAKIKSDFLKIPYVDLSGRSINALVLNIIPRKVAENYKIIAFEKAGNELKVAMANPHDYKAIEAVEFLAKESNLEVKYYLISLSGFLKTFKQYGALSEEAEEALAGVEQLGFDIEKQAEDKELQEVIKSAPVSKMVLVIIRHAVDGRASDIHIEPEIKETRVRYRIDGILRTTLVLPKYIHSAIVSRIKVLANLKLDETRKPQDGRIRLSIEGRDFDFRVSTLPLFDGEKVVMRVLDTSGGIKSLEGLGFNINHIDIIKQSIQKPHGLVLLTGPTGSGKTTTLYTILTMINKEGTNIITLEDPIEYYINGINQSQINPEVGYTFSSGLRSILRQDPNIIMLGEIRDKDTTELVIHASLTGHMVLTTLHTNDAVGAIPRLFDMGAEPFLLSSTINLIIAQRLARRICPDCKIEKKIGDEVREMIKKELESVPKVHLKNIDLDKLTFWIGEGCSHCGNLGYQGRISISEAINFDSKLQQMVGDGFKYAPVKEKLKEQNFITLRQDGIIKALSGLTTMEEVMRVTQI